MKSMKIFVVALLTLVLMNCSKNQPAPVAAPVEVTADTTVKMITARVFLKADKVDAFIEAAQAMIDSSNAEPGCIEYMLYQNPYDKTRFMFVEMWKDQAAIDAHFAMPYFTAFGPKIADWLSQPTEIKILTVVSQQ
jgi:quinol monooxygenase YgiN